jgi:type I restriction enzyme S subunit
VRVDWIECSLGDALAELKNGLNCKQEKSGGAHRISRIESISDGSFDETRVGFSDLSPTEAERFRLRRGDILFSHINSPPHVGKVAQLDTDATIYHGVNLLLMRPHKGVERRYLFYFLVQLRSSGYWELNCKKSVNQASVNQKDIGKVPFRYPRNIEEQRRIVAVLDEAFTAIATATANAEKNLANAREAFLDATDRELTAGGSSWIETTMEAICSQFEYGTSAKSKSAGQVPVLRMGNLQNSEIDWSDLVYTDDSSDIKKLSVKPMDVLFNRTNSLEHVGKAAIVRESRAAIFAGYLIRLHYRVEAVDPEFLNMHLNSRAVRSHGRALAGKSVNQANISAGKLRTYPIHLPPLIEQKKIVSKISEIRDFLERLQAIQKLKIQKLAALKQAMLNLALCSELTLAEPKPLVA